MPRTRSAHRPGAHRRGMPRAVQPPTPPASRLPFRRRGGKAARVKQPGTFEQLLTLLRANPSFKLFIGLSLAGCCLIALLTHALARQPEHAWLLPVLRALILLVLAVVYLVKLGRLAEGGADLARLRRQLAVRQPWRQARSWPARLAWLALATLLRCLVAESAIAPMEDVPCSG